MKTHQKSSLAQFEANLSRLSLPPSSPPAQPKGDVLKMEPNWEHPDRQREREHEGGGRQQKQQQRSRFCFAPQSVPHLTNEGTAASHTRESLESSPEKALPSSSPSSPSPSSDVRPNDKYVCALNKTECLSAAKAAAVAALCSLSVLSARTRLTA